MVQAVEPQAFQEGIGKESEIIEEIEEICYISRYLTTYV